MKRVLLSATVVSVLAAVCPAGPLAADGIADHGYHLGADRTLACDTAARRLDDVDIALAFRPQVTIQTTVILEIDCEGTLSPPPGRRVKGQVLMNVANQSQSMTIGPMKANYNRQGRLNVEAKVPILSDLPTIVGALFKTRGGTNVREGTRHQLLCLVRPELTEQ